ncbi:MAG: Cna protein B-type protein [Thermoleophilia bacterium]|nr:Cna protein B-type protein [Thermoleophilia bacterium]
MTRLLPSIRLRAALLSVLCAALAQPAGAMATTIHVDSSSNATAATCGSAAAPCETIDDGIDHAVAGDVLDLAPGDYQGATIDVPVQLRGAQSGVSGVTRGIDQANRTSTIRGTIVVQASVTIDGLEFRTTAGPALRFAAPLPGAGAGAGLIINSTFARIGGSQVVYASSELGGLTFSDNLFVAEPGGAHVALFVHGEFLPDGIRGVAVERNEFRGFTGFPDSAIVDAGGVPGLHVRHNVLSNSGPLLVLADTDGSTERVLVQDNVGLQLNGHAIRLGGGLDGVTIERNRLVGGTVSLYVSDDRGTGTSRDIQFRANDVSGVRTAVSASGAVLGDPLVVRGNRLLTDGAQNVVVSSITSGSIDARRNWWGRSAGLATSAVNGPADVSEPLRLVGVEAPAAVLVGGSGVVSVRLVGPIGGNAETDAAGFPVTFTSTNATLDAASVTVAFGTASTLFTAGTSAGSTTTTATLDGESVSATTKILANGSDVPTGLAEPSVAESAAPRIGFRASVQATGRLAVALRNGLSQIVVTNRSASVRTTYLVSHYTARLLGLRPATSTSHDPFVIGAARTRAVQGRRLVTVEIRQRPRFAIARYGKRVEVLVVTHVRTSDGTTRSVYRRIVLPATVR